MPLFICKHLAVITIVLPGILLLHCRPKYSNLKSCIIQSRQSSVRTGLLWSFFIYYQYIFHFIGTSQDNPDICAILLLLRVFNRLTPKRTLLPSVRMLFYKSWMLFHKSCNTVFQNGLWWHNWVPRLLSASYKLNDSSSPCVILWWSIGVPNNDIQGNAPQWWIFPSQIEVTLHCFCDTKTCGWFLFTTIKWNFENRSFFSRKFMII